MKMRKIEIKNGDDIWDGLKIGLKKRKINKEIKYNGLKVHTKKEKDKN